ncbi:MAG: hypothetical protein II453_09905 [Alphaproteobacteria bacterium]|nr:hypothetical protein [Alphaproteobacteria bacterium]MBQ3946366.1 hypothetical protein [Alphaproteobacteria bacterium]
MKIADFFINIGTQGDTKELDKAIKKMDEAQAKEKARAQFKEKIVRINRLIEKATKAEQVERLKSIKNQIKDNYVNDIKLKRLKAQSASIKEQNAQWIGLVKGVTAFVTGVTTAVFMMDRLSNSVLKTNQLYTNFSKQTGISIGNLNRMAGLAKLSGMNLPVEQVASDLNSLQQKIFRLGLTGEGSGIFAQLGMNPIGMNSDDFITSLRQRFKGLNEVQKSYVLDQLGLSREWLNVLDLSDDVYSNLIKESKKLQLSEYERKEIAKYTLIQQQNNMRFELAKQKLLVALLPIMTKLTEAASKFAMAFSNDKGVSIMRDLAFWLGIAAMRAGVLRKALGFLTGAGLMAKTGAKIGAKAALGGSNAWNPVGWGLLIWTAVDIFQLLKQWFTKDTEADDNEAPTDIPPGLQYATVSSNIANHFYNNPAPQQAITSELDWYVSRYISGAKK